MKMITRPPELVKGKPLLLDFGIVRAIDQAQASAPVPRTGRIGMLLPEGVPNFVVGVDATPFEVWSLLIMGNEQVMSKGMPLSVFVQLMLSGALAFEVVPAGSRLHMRVFNRTNEPKPLQLIIVPLVVGGE